MSGKTRSWIEIGSVFALVGGLVLVAAQIKQSTDITRVQLDTSVRQNWRTVDSTRQGEEFAKVLANLFVTGLRELAAEVHSDGPSM